ncbi:MAG: hypothetical protein AAB262_03800, partial [Elusimicrobiota bacterium]
KLTIYKNSGLTFNNKSTSTLLSVAMFSGSSMTHADHDFGVAAMAADVNLKVLGDFDLKAGATVTVSQRGFSRGSGGPGYCGASTGTGAGQCDQYGSAGSSYGGQGGFGGSDDNEYYGPAYGSITNPVELGSGGPGGYAAAGYGRAGGDGGGLVILDVGGAFTLNGSIRADGGNAAAPGADANGGGGGSGGAINIKAGTLSGSGTLTALGGKGAMSDAYPGGGGGGGRIAVVVTGSDSSTLSLNAGPGATISPTWGRSGGVGTIAWKRPAAGLYDLKLLAGATVAQSATPIYGETFDQVTVSGLVLATGTASGVGFFVTATDFSIPSGSTLSATGMGHPGGQGGDTNCMNGLGPGAGTCSLYGNPGAGYGGLGGWGGYNRPKNVGPSYGSLTNPAELGSGG